MSPVRVTMKRTVGMVGRLYVSALSIAAFFAGAAALFAFNLDAAEGTFSALAPLWTASVSPILPVLAALLGMEVWSDELKTGRIEILLATPVRERDFVVGKFLGVWLLVFMSTVLFLGSTLLFLNSYAPNIAGSVSLTGFLPGLFLLALQGALWSAVAVTASALFRNAAGAAAMTIFALVALPRALWIAFSYWMRDGSTHFGELPMDEHAYDFASGLVSVGTVLSYVILIFFALFFASKTVSSLRLAGRSGRMLRFTTRVSVLLAFVFSVLTVGLVNRVDVTLDIPVAGSGDTVFSPRTCNILEQTRGNISITAFVDRKDPRFRHANHFLRSLKRQTDETGGVRIDIRHVDPVLDTAEAVRFVRAGVGKSSFVFERDGRIVDTLSMDMDYGERIFADMIGRIAVPFHRSCVYWTTGHGEASYENYEPDGLSEIAKSLAGNGYGNRKINLADERSVIGEDCALVVVAGPAKDFSQKELARLQFFLDGRIRNNEGGRVLVLLDTAELQGLSNLLSLWGIRPGKGAPANCGTMSGSDVVVTGFSDRHPVTRPFFEKLMILLEKPVLTFTPSSSAIEGEGGADLKRYSVLLDEGGACFAAAVERGSLGSDIAIRPSRLIAIGDVGFVMNGKLRAYGNANRDFFLNAVNYLSGRDSMTSAGTETDRLVTGMDRRARSGFAAATSAVFPAAFFALYALLILWRRRRR